MKRLRKVLTVFSLVFIGLVLALILIAELAENKVADIALRNINEGVDATIAVENIDLSLIANLPDVTLEFNNVEVTTANDTLTQIERLYISAELMPLFKNRFNIIEIALEGGWLNYKIDSAGKTNFDAFLGVPDEEQPEDSTSNQLYLSLKHLELNNIFFSFTDIPNDINACLYIDQGLTSVYIDDYNQKIAFDGALRANQCKYPQSKLHLMEEIKVELDVTYFNEKVTLTDCYIETDGANLKASGEISLGDDIYTDVSISSSQFDIRELSKYIPDTLMSNYDVRYVSGLASLQADIKGIYNDSIMPRIDASLQLAEGSIAVGDYPLVNQIRFAGTYSNGELMNEQTTSVDIDTLAFRAGASYGFVSGSINNLNKISYRARADLQLDLDDIFQHLPDSLIDDLSGKVMLNASTYGVMPNEFNVQFADYVLGRTKLNMQLADVGVKIDSLITINDVNGQLASKKQGFQIDSLSMILPDYGLNLTRANIYADYEGQLTQLNTLGVNISNFDIATDHSWLKGQASFKNPDYPVYKLDADAMFNLNELMVFVPDSIIKSMTGYVSASVKTGGQLHLDSIADNMMETLFTQSSLNAQLNNVGVEMESYPVTISHLGGKLGLQSDSINVDGISGDFNGIEFDADSTFVKNIYSAYWLNQSDTIMAEGYINLGDIDYVMFEPFMVVEETEETEIQDEEKESEPSRYHFAAKGKVTAKSFWYGNALLENLSALYNVSDSLYIADQIKLDAFKGQMNSSVRVEMQPDEVMKINFKNSTQGLDINQLLYDFDDFMDYSDEVYISHEQLSGILTTDSLSGQFIFAGDSIDIGKVKLKANLTLEDGRLKDYPITKEMGEDYNIDGLDDLQFKTLNTKLFVTGGSIYAPLTNIKTNTFDISLFGKQEFDLDCQYHIRFYLKEILRKGKTNRLERKQSKEGKQDDYGGTKGLTSLFAVYKIEDGKTVKSSLEGKDSQMRKKMKSLIYVKEAFAELEFHPLIVKYNTGVVDYE
ncbi:MAG: AsmA family protein [Bacteroidales bacterium]|nr:AsmA family protein [Bacteroidales bacterium]